MGVRRAMEMALAASNGDEGPIYTYGPLIHNRQVLDLLESKNVKAAEDISEIQSGTLLIRAHGIPPEQRKQLKSSPLKVIDATCPRVVKVQSIIRYHTHKGYTPIIVGDRNHAEVIGLMGYGEGRAHVIDSASEVSGLPDVRGIFLVAQTTQNKETYREIAEAVKERYPDALIFDTICEATSQRQEEAKNLAGHVDAMVVVGGYHSANTRRLVQISEATGTPTFHVETEKEMNKEALTPMEVIGVTAGASTPNWMIKNVVKEIESVHGRGETFMGRWIRKILKFLLLSNFLVALGAFSLSYATAVLVGRTPGIIYPLLAFLYIYAMHVLNRFLDKGASTYNDPESAGYYRKHWKFFVITGILSVIGTLAFSWYLSPSVFFAIAGFSLLGVIYSLTIVPAEFQRRWRYSKIKDIPGSKTLLEAVAWAVVITLLPLLETSIAWPAVIVSFFIVLSFAFVRSAFFDILQAQGDLIVGVETLPITLGEKRTLILLKWIIGTCFLILVLSSMLRLVSPFGLVLFISLLTLCLCLLIYENRRIYPGPLLEYLVEGNLFLAGLLGFIWQIIT